jgi:hypothetical protein
MPTLSMRLRIIWLVSVASVTGPTPIALTLLGTTRRGVLA